MGLWKRAKSIFKSKANAAMDSMEDPEQMLNQMIVDMQEQIVKAKKQVAVAIADEKRLNAQYKKEADQAAEWEKKAMFALKSGKEDLAKEALGRKAEHDNLAAEYQKQWQLQKNATDKLRTQLKSLNGKVDDAKRKKNLLVARAKRAKAQKTIQDTMSGLSDTGAFDTFDRMSQKVDQIEAEAEASAELAEDLNGGDADLDKQFAELETSSSADADLLELKKKMGLLPAGDEGA